MVRPTQALHARLRLTTKQVGRGYYKGNRVGSTGSHTRYGGYVIDWRKVRNYNVPDLTGFKLTPYVSREINPRDYDPEDEGNQTSTESTATFEDNESHLPMVINNSKENSDELQRKLVKYLTAWRKANPSEFEQFTRYQYNLRQEEETKPVKDI